MASTEHSKRPPQWLALHFPHMALDQHNRDLDEESRDMPLAVSDKLAGRQCIVDRNHAAERAGIRIGMPTSAALGLLDTLQVSVRDRRVEQAVLKRLASWC
mgnify:CR=1 FL=1